MAKTVNEVLASLKGTGKENDTLTGQGSFSKAGFSDLVTAMINDTSFSIPTYDKDGKVSGSIKPSELARADIAKTVDNAKYPQKSEAAVLNQAEIECKGIASIIPYAVEEYIKTGRKFDLPVQPEFNGSVYLTPVKGTVKEVSIRDPKTQEPMGTCTITSKDSIKVATKSPVPAHLQTKVRKDPSGKIVK